MRACVCVCALRFQVGDQKWREAKARGAKLEADRKEKMLEKWRARDQRQALAEQRGAVSRVQRTRKTQVLVMNKIAKVRERREHMAEAEARTSSLLSSIRETKDTVV